VAFHIGSWVGVRVLRVGLRESGAVRVSAVAAVCGCRGSDLAREGSRRAGSAPVFGRSRREFERVEATGRGHSDVSAMLARVGAVRTARRSEANGIGAGR